MFIWVFFIVWNEKKSNGHQPTIENEEEEKKTISVFTCIYTHKQYTKQKPMLCLNPFIFLCFE